MEGDFKSVENLSQEELLSLVKNFMGEKGGGSEESNDNNKKEGEGEKTKKRGGGREFDPSKYGERFVAFKIAYLGWRYQGFAFQPHTPMTVEEQLFFALKKTTLISSSPESCNYSRCGRTDSGVSGTGQVVALKVRSVAGKLGDLGVVSEAINIKEQELNYPQVLNSALPPDIRVIGWCPVSPSFSARFSCRYRSYKYFFIRADLDISRMREAATYYIGEHDFRNFCKVDPKKIGQTFNRCITAIDISPFDELTAKQPENQLFVVNVTGTAFLWHQVRCMVQILFVIGSHAEDIQIIPRMLDVERMPEKPNYNIAPSEPLVLWECGFDPNEVNWIVDQAQQGRIYSHFRAIFQESSIKTALAIGLLGLFPMFTPSYREDDSQAKKSKISPTPSNQPTPKRLKPSEDGSIDIEN